MIKSFLHFILICLVVGCIEPYDFVIKNDEPTLVVEAYISDRSYQETLTYPSDGRYFTVKLSLTSDVKNVRSNPIQFAQVQLLDNSGRDWVYTESAQEPGLYALMDEEFKAQAGVQYKLRIHLPDESIFESEWEALPQTLEPPMGELNFKEVSVQKYVIQAKEKVLVSVKGIQTLLSLPENTTNKPLYYKWSFIPHWIYIAPLSPSIILPGYKCWATSPFYLSHYSLQLDNTGGYIKDLFFLETIRNERIFEKFSALIVQQAMTEDYYSFWKEMQEQNEGGAIFDKPPFNLATNFHPINTDKPVSGYFGIVHEQAKRWYFDRSALSYVVQNTLKRDCTVPFQDPAPECFDCRQYSFGDVVNGKPSWWVD